MFFSSREGVAGCFSTVFAVTIVALYFIHNVVPRAITFPFSCTYETVFTSTERETVDVKAVSYVHENGKVIARGTTLCMK